ncbi:pyridoxal 5'-phosphate synthase lyase subunit PdxS [Ignicoccus hospitalis]|uniref:Pyridoxal 5'-phosphate synthase subunit PdxS n=1 Tax=Ignicoccus hospitalis (strain KIN4/I / DSM 18386 / JCM 14125) TaxID=453591 RepID=A8A8T8_IGNH4|nr:pyridoxal 5'-phosphate synthase lyase subunit PdxS [Ignicoccus hospitalis]ABU81340.1 Vitamin B6 biosynthesis protein [Ignicoccus hospitalis KIN4/I]HIH90357.1 pyridoxal 5'-phosphate synthase lyase subunit PdxS [Desulfurococcaceae archaeon]
MRHRDGLVEVGFDAIANFFYKLAETADKLKEEGLWTYLPDPREVEREVAKGTVRAKLGFPVYQKGGVIMDVTNIEQAEIAEDAGAVAVMVLDKLPYDIRKSGGVARMADVNVIREVMDSISLPVMAKVRIGHFMEAKVLEALGVDMIDESEVLTPADEKHHINKWLFKVPFVNGARNLGEALRRISEGASMIRTKGEAGTGNVVEAVKHMKTVMGEIREIVSMSEEDRVLKAREMGVSYELVELVARLRRLPVVNFAAGGIATPADAALMMWLGADGVFVGSGIFKSEDPRQRAEAIVLATSLWMDPEAVLEAQSMISERKSMMGIDVKQLKPEELLQVRGE